MCRSIKTLRGTEPSDQDIRAAALQFVRKVSGYRAPSRANAPAFEAAVEEITQASARLLAAMPISAPPPPRPRERRSGQIRARARILPESSQNEATGRESIL